MQYSLVKRDPNKAYIDTWLWLPKSRISIETVKRGLSFQSIRSGTPETINIWSDSPLHLGIPRARLNPASLGYEVVDLRPRSFKKVSIKSNVVLDQTAPTKDDQLRAFEDLSEADGGILNMSCGRGKTVICLHTIAHWSEPTIVICSSTHLMEQWKREIREFLEVDGVGWIQGKPKTWDWDKPIVLASLKTLAIYHDKTPPEMLIHFGRVIWDEIHHLSAREFSKTAPLFIGHRYGASATTSRADGTEFVYYWHVGKEVHTNLKQDVIPTILFRKSRTTVDLYHKDVVDKSGQPHLRRLARHVGLQENELKLAVDLVTLGLKAGRDIVAISSSKDHARELHKRVPNSGILDAGVLVKDRLGMLQDHKITFGTIDMLSEALNKKELDSLLILTEFSSKNRAQQAVGRIQRLLLGVKKQARVIVVWHVNVEPMKRMGLKLMSYFKQCGFEVKIK